MATDHSGTTLANGDNVWIPATVSSAGASGITVACSYGGTNVNLQGTQVHKDKPHSFPDAP